MGPSHAPAWKLSATSRIIGVCVQAFGGVRPVVANSAHQWIGRIRGGFSIQHPHDLSLVETNAAIVPAVGCMPLLYRPRSATVGATQVRWGMSQAVVARC
jgi:hypothetical protein